MENLSLRDLPQGGGPNHAQPAPGTQPQLPPQMFTTAAQLLDLTDTNLVLQETIERIFVKEAYADISRGIYLVRGENVLLLGEIDLDKDEYVPAPFQKVSAEEIHALRVGEQKEEERSAKVRAKKLKQLGFEAEHAGEVLF
ncbi:hypothetical protein ACLMJK_005354 [Lecanora helva]